MLRAAFIFCMILCGAVSAQSPTGAFPPGVFETRAALDATPSSYTGPGDVVSGATAWWGLRAYNSAKRGTVAVNVCNVSDVVCSDLSTDAISGDLVVSTIGGSSCSVVACTIKTWYDQSGNTNCGGAACNFTQATIAKRAVLIIAGGTGCSTTSLACAKFDDSTGNNYYAVATALTGAQPFTVSSVARRNSVQSSGYGTVLNNTGATVGVYLRTADIDLFIGADHTSSATTNDAYHAAQSIGNGASSSISVDGSGTSFSAAGTALAVKGIGSDSSTGGSVLNGYIVEIGFWSSAFSAGNITAMNSNQHAYWGF